MRIINKKQHIAVRAYWIRGGPGPACTISINGIGVGTYTSPVAAMNTCANTTSMAGMSMIERVNSSLAPSVANNVAIVRGNIPSCYMTSLPGYSAFPGTNKQKGTFSGLDFLNATADGKVTITFNWANSAFWPNCCTRSANSSTDTIACGWGGAVMFDIAYLWSDGSLDSGTVASAMYTSLVTWSFSNLINITNSPVCADPSSRISRTGGYNTLGNLCANSCTSFNPSNPNLTTVVVPCPSC